MVVRVFEALFFGPDFGVELAFYEFAYLFERRGVAHAFSVFHDEFAQFADCVVGECVALPRLLRVYECIVAAEVGRFVFFCDEVRDRPAVGIVDAPEAFFAGVRYFFKCFGYFDGRAAGFAFVHRDEFVDGAEDGVAFRRDEALAYAE